MDSHLNSAGLNGKATETATWILIGNLGFLFILTVTNSKKRENQFHYLEGKILVQVQWINEEN